MTKFNVEDANTREEKEAVLKYNSMLDRVKEIQVRNSELFPNGYKGKMSDEAISLKKELDQLRIDLETTKDIFC